MKHYYQLLFFVFLAAFLPAQRVQLVEGTYTTTAYVAQRNTLYAAQAPVNDDETGALSSIDPGSGEVLARLELGGEPYLLRATTSGDYLFVAFRQSNRVVRVDLRTLTIDQDFLLAGDRSVNPANIFDLLPLRGSDDRIVVASVNACCTPAFQGLLLIDQGEVVSRAAAAFGFTSVLAYTADDEILLGFDTYSGESTYQTISVAGGSLQVREPNFLFIGNPAQIKYAEDGRLYSSTGFIGELRGELLEQVAEVPVFNYLQYYGISSVAADPAADRVYYLGYNYNDRLSIAEHSASTYDLLSTYELLGRGRYNYGNNVTDLERLGTPGTFAFLSGTGVLGLTSLCASTLTDVPPAYTGPSNICFDQTLLLTVPEGVRQDGQGVLWSDGQRGDSILISEGGIYSYRLTDASGCPGPFSESFYIDKQEYPDSPPFLQDPLTDVLCEGSELKLIANWYYENSVEWNTGLRSDTLTVTEAGTYSARALNPFTGCYSESTSPIEIRQSSEPAPATPVVLPGTNVDTCTFEPVVLTLQEPAQEYFWELDGYLYSTENNLVIYNRSDPAVYSVRTKNAGGCISPKVTGTVRFFQPVPAPVLLYNQGSQTLVATGTSGPVRWYRNGVFEAETQSLFYEARGNGFYTARARGEGCLSEESNLISVDGVTAVAELENVAGIDVFPNPVSDALTVTIDVPALVGRPLSYTLVNVTGQQVRSGQLTAAPISVRGLATGVYVLWLREGAREVVRQRVVVN